MKKIIFNVNNVNTELTTEDDEVIIFNNEGEFHYYKGKWHREDGPAAITKEYSTWLKNGIITRDEKDGPAITRNKFANGSQIEFPISIWSPSSQWSNSKDISEDFQQIEYWKDGKVHRDDGPAIIITFKINGISYKFEYWFKNGISFNIENEKSSVGYKENKLIFYKYTNEKGELHFYGDDPAYFRLYNVGDSETSEYTYYKNGLEHRDNDLPSHESFKSKRWKKNGKFYRSNNLPTLINYFDDGIKIRQICYYLGDKLYREDGPSYILYEKGKKVKSEYYINGQEICYFLFYLKRFFRSWD